MEILTKNDKLIVAPVPGAAMANAPNNSNQENSLPSDTVPVKGSTETMNITRSQTKVQRSRPHITSAIVHVLGLQFFTSRLLPSSPAAADHCVQRNPVYVGPLEKWDREMKLSSKRVDELKAERARLRRDLYQALAYYLALQVGNLVLAKLFAHRTHSCKVFWSPFYIHVSVCLWIFFGTCVRVAVVMTTMSTNRMELETQEAECTMITDVARALRAQGQAFQFDTLDLELLHVVGTMDS